MFFTIKIFILERWSAVEAAFLSPTVISGF